MQVRDVETQILYGLFKSLCEWAAEKGVNDIAALKDLLKLAMVEVYMEKHKDLSPSRAHMTVAIDLGISLRTVETSLKQLRELDDISPGFIQLHPLLRRISVLLVNSPQTVDDLVNEVAPLIHAPYELQRSIILSIMKSLEQARIVCTQERDGQTVYSPIEGHIVLYYPGDTTARLSGMVNHVEAYEHRIREPFLKVFHLSSDQAKQVQAEVAKALRDLATEKERECRSQFRSFRCFYYFLGSTPLVEASAPLSVGDVILRNIKLRFADPSSSSMASTHWYDLTPECAVEIFNKVSNGIERTGAIQNQTKEEKGSALFAFYLGLADFGF